MDRYCQLQDRAAQLVREFAASGPVLAETLARYAANLKYEDIPGDVVRMEGQSLPALGREQRQLVVGPR